jgi:hypothetical protein
MRYLELTKGKFAQYKKAAKSLEVNSYYKVGRPYYAGGTIDIYFVNEYGTLETLCYNTTPHRAKVLLNAHLNNTIKNVSDTILGNYRTNGYTTRRGLFADYSSKEERMKRIAKSHSTINDCVNSTSEHNLRVFLRN